MKRHIATALLVGMGIAGETPKATASELRENIAGRQLHNCTTCRAPEFGHLKSAGQIRRAQIATLFIDDGTLFAEYSGQVDAPQPRRIETEELDAEWMAHTTDGKWFLTRRELMASDGKLWTIQIYGDTNDAANVQLIATINNSVGIGGKNARTVHYTQTADSAHLSIRGTHEGLPLGPWTAVAANLSALRTESPGLVKDFLEPALAKMVC